MNGSTLGPNSTDATNAFTSSGLSWGGTGDFVTTEAACKFVNAAAGNFRLQAGSSLIGKGINLSSDLSMSSKDADGNVRPSTGAWDIGPFQYSAGGTNTAPSPPTNLRLVNGILSWSAVSGATYRVDYKSNVNQATWEVRGNVTATNAAASFAETFAAWPQCFYRVVAVQAP